MLDAATRRKIDSARDILVGKVPDPKTQVAQITTALVYKFMDDMDKESQALGGKANFFTDEFKKYSWTKLLDKRLTGQERFDLYTQAITNMSGNPHIPQLFRDIFKDAFLPFRDPETLSLFLKEINGFTYDHSEDLGDAFEYLLSVLGSQGDAGQFRTPRHIIDCIVEVVDPKKNETILDPACGTSGFLISAYKHILKQNTEKPLTPDEKLKLVNNLVGYDISPDMVRLSLVNMYLHNFPEPKIDEYDTLTNEKRWGEQFDVIMANPPFMTPKGGIRPHRRFAVQAKRSEVLFVDYILEHLNLKGRAGIIVPEGIIFKAENAYKKLRQMLLADGLFAVISLPPGVFNPYSGVKTSILFFDIQLAKKSDEILFLKIDNDGFDLGAQRRKIEKNDLPEALQVLEAWKQGQKKASNLALWAKKEKIAADGDYNLNGERYREIKTRKHQKWPLVELGEVCEFNPKKSKVKDLSKDTMVSFVPMADLGEHQVNFEARQGKKIKDVYSGYTYFAENDVLLARVTPCFENGKSGIAKNLMNGVGFGSSEYLVYRANIEKILPKFLYYFIASNDFIKKGKNNMTGTGGLQRLTKDYATKYKIPLPPLEVQKEIVEQIEVKQNAINHAREIIKNLDKERQYFGQEVGKLKDVEWVELGEVCEVARGGSPRPIDKFITNSENGINWIKIGDVKEGEKYITKTNKKIKLEGASKTRLVEKGDFILSNSMSFGRPYILKISGAIHDGWLLLRLKNKNVSSDFLYYILGNSNTKSQFGKSAIGGVVKNLNSELVKKIKISLPPLKIQKQLVAQVEKEEEIVAANRRLIELMEGKIARVIAEI